MTPNKTQKVPHLARLLLKQMTVYNERHSIIEDFEETFHEISQTEGILRAKCWYWMSVLKSFPEYLRLIFVWRVIMFLNYLKIAYRYFIGNKLFSFINVFGLAIGIATCVIISLWVQRELSYDHFHKNAHRIYRIERELFRDNLYSRWP
ncbi:MAG: ABC transporter permease, partial [bacterium]